MASMSITPDRDAISARFTSRHLPSRYFKHWLNPDKCCIVGAGWRLSLHESDVRTGGKWRSAGEGGDSGKFTVAGEYLEVDSPRLLVYSWVASWAGNVRTTVRWELEASSKGTLVRLRHSGLAAHPEVAQSYRGWPRMLGWLQAFIEKGETIEMRKPLSA